MYSKGYCVCITFNAVRPTVFFPTA